MIKVTVELKSTDIAPLAFRGSDSLAARISRNTAQRGLKYARENVAPGKGPGPHPHRPGSDHVDTGALRDSLKVTEGWGGDLLFEGMPTNLSWVTAVSTHLDYGLYLEMGWTTRRGTHYRYPWLFPAMTLAQRDFAHLARTTAMRWVEQYQRGYARIGNAPVSATWLPE